MIDPGLKDKVAIVTGANHGIGAATALALAKQGAKVFINFWRQSPELYGESKENAEKAVNPGKAYYSKMISQSADEVKNMIMELGTPCYSWEADLSDVNNIPTLFDLAEEHLGKVNIVVNNAAFDRLDTFLPLEEIEKKLAATYPLKRVGNPEDIAKAVLFFASVQADWITCQVLYVGGGNRM